LPGIALACGNPDGFPHRLEGSEGTIYNSNECHPVKLIVPTRYKSAKLDYATLMYQSPTSKATALEAAVSFRESPDKENESEIDLCINHEVASKMAVELIYSPYPNEERWLTMCRQRYIINGFIEHMSGS